MDTRRNLLRYSEALVRAGGVSSFLLAALVLVQFHIRTEAAVIVGDGEPSFSERIRKGPAGLTILDKILFGALMLIAFEVLDYITKHVGRKCHDRTGLIASLMFRNVPDVLCSSPSMARFKANPRSREAFG